MKSKVLIDVVGVLVVLSILAFSVVPIEAQGYSEVIHTTRSECLIYDVERTDFYLNVSAIYNIYDNGSLIRQEIPVWVVKSDDNSSIINVVFRKYVSDISQNSTSVYEEVYNISYGKYVLVEFSDRSTSLLVFDDSRNLVESYQEGVNGSLEIVYAWGYGISKVNTSCSEFFNSNDSLGGIVEGSVIYYFALSYLPVTIIIIWSVWYFVKKKLVMRKVARPKK